MWIDVAGIAGDQLNGNATNWSPTRPDSGGVVVGLPYSGSGLGQWRRLAGKPSAGFRLIASAHNGSERTGPWSGERVFPAADEAARTIALMDQAAAQVHLGSHSCGGVIALHAAIVRPDRVATLSLNEPTNRFGPAKARRQQ